MCGTEHKKKTINAKDIREGWTTWQPIEQGK